LCFLFTAILANLIRPLLRGRDIKKWKAEFANKYIILAIFGSHRYLQNKYPAIYEHLSQFKNQLENRGQCRYGGKGNQGMHHWLELDNCPSQKYMDDFYKDKIVWAEMTDINCFFLDTEKNYINQTCYFIPENSKFILAVLNSKLSYFYMKTIANTLGNGALRWFKQYVEMMPIPLNNNWQQKIESKVTTLLDCNKNNKDVTIVENELNELIFTMYGLTETEKNYLTK